MPLDGSGNYYYPLGTPGVPNQTIESVKYNTFLDDLVMNDLNVPRPIHRGGTGASNANAARTEMGSAAAMQTVTNYDTHVFENGFFWSAIGATASPGSSAYSGLSVVASNNPDFITLEAYDTADASLQYVRQKVTGVWGAWARRTTLADADARYVNLTGDTMTGVLTTPGLISTGYVVSDQVFSTSSISIVLAPTGAGTVYLRPNGAAVSTGEAKLFTTGVFSVSQISTDNVQSAGTNLFLGGAGGSVFLRPHGAANTASQAYQDATGTFYTTNVSAAYVASTGNIEAAGTVAGAQMTVQGYGVWHSGNFDPNNYSGDFSATGFLRAGHGQTGGRVYLGNSGQNLNFNLANVDGWRLQGGSGGFHIDTNAVKPGGGTWDAPSDGRVKTLLGEYEHGLKQITRLKPQRFKYKDKSFDLVKDREFIGFVAQDVEPVMPEMVSKKNGVIDGKEVNDFRMTDTSALIFALVNAVRELSDRVEELESAG